jgi:hypothetical protein
MTAHRERELEPKESLHANCSRCAALCCVAPSFSASEEFATDKLAGVACPNLVAGHACGIHSDLRAAGYRGCATFDCFGAGQHVSTHTCAGVRWEEGGQGATSMFAVFHVMRQLKELLWHLSDAADVAETARHRTEVQAMRQAVQALVWEDAATLAVLDLASLQQRAFQLLADVSSVHRGGLAACCGLPLAAADLRHANLTRTNLRGADLRYAQLAMAVLAGADLTGADLFGADLRGADVRGAQLAGSLYLTPLQVQAAHGDETTTLPGTIERPAHWRNAGPNSSQPSAPPPRRSP